MIRLWVRGGLSVTCTSYALLLVHCSSCTALSWAVPGCFQLPVPVCILINGFLSVTVCVTPACTYFLQSITLDHKKYEEAITGVGASFKRSLAVREKRRLELIDQPPAAASAAAADKNAGKAVAGARRPKYFREVGGGGGGGEDPTAAARGREQQQRRAGGREHLPPASSSLDTYTLLKFYSLSAPILQSVFRGLQDAEVGRVSWGLLGGASAESMWLQTAAVTVEALLLGVIHPHLQNRDT